jgi:hypothetical protein
VGNLGYFEAKLGSGTCSMTTQDLMTGNEVTITLPVTGPVRGLPAGDRRERVLPATCPR